MINSALVEKKKPPSSVPTYPYIGMINNSYSGLVSFAVLFHAPSRGMIVYSADHSDRRIGTYEESWYEDRFHRLDTAITIQNDSAES